MEKDKIEEIKRRLGCLVPKPNAKQHFITSHEKTLCDCEVLKIVAEVERLESENGVLKEENGAAQRIRFANENRKLKSCLEIAIRALEKQTGTFSDPFEDRERAMAAREALVAIEKELSV